MIHCPVPLSAGGWLQESSGCQGCGALGGSLEELSWQQGQRISKGASCCIHCCIHCCIQPQMCILLLVLLFHSPEKSAFTQPNQIRPPYPQRKHAPPKKTALFERGPGKKCFISRPGPNVLYSNPPRGGLSRGALIHHRVLFAGVAQAAGEV